MMCCVLLIFYNIMLKSDIIEFEINQNICTAGGIYHCLHHHGTNYLAHHQHEQ